MAAESSQKVIAYIRREYLSALGVRAFWAGFVPLIVACTSTIPKPVGTEETPVSTNEKAPASPASSVAPSYQYTATFDKDLSGVRVQLCAPIPVRQLEPSSPTAKRLLEEAEQEGRPCEIADGFVQVPSARASCINYRVNLKRIFASASGMDGALRLGDAAVLSPDLWLWTPEPRDPNVPSKVRVELPPGMMLTLPWAQPEGGWATIPESAFVWKTQGAIGRLKKVRLPPSVGPFSVSLLPPAWGSQTATIVDWVQRSAKAVTTSLGHAPLHHANVVLAPKAMGTYGFGYATRGGGDVAVLLVDPRISKKELDTNWMAVHEILHFVLPTMSNEDAWLYEGLVTYLAAVVRAKTGMVSESFAWGELLDGFVRGGGAGTGVSLRKESAGMLRTGSYWRVYWWGALIALEWDMKLHARNKSLLGVLRKLELSQFRRIGDYSADEVLEVMDRLSGEDIFRSTARQHLDSKEYPDYRRIQARLGLRLRSDQTAEFDPKAPRAAMRVKIMQPFR